MCLVYIIIYIQYNNYISCGKDIRQNRREHNENISTNIHVYFKKLNIKLAIKNIEVGGRERGREGEELQQVIHHRFCCSYSLRFPYRCARSQGC